MVQRTHIGQGMIVASNYQHQIRIGCFTDSSDNEKMWGKYASASKEYCIQYDTRKNELFQISTLPVAYTEKLFDSSMTLAYSLLLDSCQKEKSRSLEENLKVFEPIYAKILKLAYIPIFIKYKREWQFEREYRLFLLQHRNTRKGMITMEQYLNEFNNIDLSNAVGAIYLGRHFDDNKNSSEILKRLEIVANDDSRRIPVYRKIEYNGKIINERIF